MQSSVSYGWSWLCSHSHSSWCLEYHTSPSPPCSLLGYAYCNSRCFAAGIITGAVRRAAILSEASGWALKTAWRSSLHGINRGWLLNCFKWYCPVDGGDCINLFLGTCSCNPTRERETAARSVLLAKKAGIWCANRTNLKTRRRKPCYVICWGRWKDTCCINQEFLDHFFPPL